MQWASSISTQSSALSALTECEEAVRRQLGTNEPDLVVVFASPFLDAQEPPIARTLHERFPNAILIGCTGAGVIGGGREVERTPALSITAASLPDVTLTPFWLRSGDLPTPDDPPGVWAERLNTPLDGGQHFIIMAEPFSFSAEALLAGLDFAFPDAAKIGGLASGGNRPGTQALYFNGEVLREGAIGVALSGNIVVDTVVAQGCRPIGHPMRVTLAERNLLLTADDRPPVETLQELYEHLGPRDQDLVEHNLFMGVAMDPLLDNVGPGDFLIRNIIGADPNRGAVAVGAELSEGQIVQFHVRDAETSAEDLRLALGNYRDGMGPREATAALMFQCTGRGQYLYGDEGHDISLFNEIVGLLPVGGFFCNGEIGPVSGATYLHGYTSSFAIFRERTTAD